MRKPLMAVLLLFLCFPLLAAIPMALAAFVGSRIPLPSWVSEAEREMGEPESVDARRL